MLLPLCGLLQVNAPAISALLHLNPQERPATNAREAIARLDTASPLATHQMITPRSHVPPSSSLLPDPINLPTTPSPLQTTEFPGSPLSLESHQVHVVPAPDGSPGSSGLVTLSANPLSPNRPKECFGNYRLLRLLGRGGFADVYLAEHIHLDTQAAIKVLHTMLTGQDQEHFRSEGRIIAHLAHPHIVRVLDFDVEGPVPFLVMDYAPNGTLRGLHPKGTRLPLACVVSYVKQVASALDYAHDEKIVHRDIKPENMLLGRHQEVLLSDFGIAVMAHSSYSLSTQNVAGTASYMAPEHIQGKPRPSSDQYSLAIVVYEWISGCCPFQGSFTELCTQHLFSTPPPLREKVPELPFSLENVILTALEKDPHRRFASVQAFANALEKEFLTKADNRISTTEISYIAHEKPSMLKGRMCAHCNQALRMKRSS